MTDSNSEAENGYPEWFSEAIDFIKSDRSQLTIERLEFHKEIADSYIKLYEAILKIPEQWVQIIKLSELFENINCLSEDSTVLEDLFNYLDSKQDSLSKALHTAISISMSKTGFDRETLDNYTKNANHFDHTAIAYKLTTGENPYVNYGGIHSDIRKSMNLAIAFENLSSEFTELFYQAVFQEDKVLKSIVIYKICIYLFKLTPRSDIYKNILNFLSISTKDNGPWEDIRKVVNFIRIFDRTSQDNKDKSSLLADFVEMIELEEMSESHLELACLTSGGLRKEFLKAEDGSLYKRIVEKVLASSEFAIYDKVLSEVWNFDAAKLIEKTSIVNRISKSLEGIDMTNISVVLKIASNLRHKLYDKEISELLRNYYIQCFENNSKPSKLLFLLGYYFHEGNDPKFYNLLERADTIEDKNVGLTFFGAAYLFLIDSVDSKIWKELYEERKKQNIIIDSKLTESEENHIAENWKLVEKEDSIEHIFAKLLLSDNNNREILQTALKRSPNKTLKKLSALWDLYIAPDNEFGKHIPYILNKVDLANALKDSSEELIDLLKTNKVIFNKFKRFLNIIYRLQPQHIEDSSVVINEVEVYYLSENESLGDSAFIEELNQKFEKEPKTLLQDLDKNDIQKQKFIKLYEQGKLTPKFLLFYMLLSDNPKEELIKEFDPKFITSTAESTQLLGKGRIEWELIDSIFRKFLYTDSKDAENSSIQTLESVYSEPVEPFDGNKYYSKLDVPEGIVYSSNKSIEGEKSFRSLISGFNQTKLHARTVILLLNLIDSTEGLLQNLIAHGHHKKFVILATVIQLAHEFHLDEIHELEQKLNRLRILYVYLVAKRYTVGTGKDEFRRLERILFHGYFLSTFSDTIDSIDKWVEIMNAGYDIHINNLSDSLKQKYYIYEESDDTVDNSDTIINPINFPLPDNNALNEAAEIRLRSISGMRKLQSGKGEYVAKLARSYWVGDEERYLETRNGRREMRHGYLQANSDSKRIVRSVKNREKYDLDNFYEYSGYGQLDESQKGRFEYRVNAILNYFTKNYNIPEPLKSAITNGNRAYYIDYEKLYSSKLIKWLVTLDHANYSSGLKFAVEDEPQKFEWLLRLMMFDISSCVTFRKENRKRKNLLLNSICETETFSNLESIQNLVIELTKRNINKREENFSEQMVRINREIVNAMPAIDLQRINQEVRELKYTEIDGKIILKSLVNIHLVEKKKAAEQTMQTYRNLISPNEDRRLFDQDPQEVRNMETKLIGSINTSSNELFDNLYFIETLNLGKLEKDVAGYLESDYLNIDEIRNSENDYALYSLQTLPNSGVLYPLNFPFTTIRSVQITNQYGLIESVRLPVNHFGGIDFSELILEGRIKEIKIVEVKNQNYDEIRRISGNITFVPINFNNNLYKYKDLEPINQSIKDTTVESLFENVKKSINFILKKLGKNFQKNFENLLLELERSYSRMMYDLQPSKYNVVPMVSDSLLLQQILNPKIPQELKAAYCEVASKSLTFIFKNLSLLNSQIHLHPIKTKYPMMAIKNGHSKNIVVTPKGYYIIDLTPTKDSPTFDPTVTDVNWKDIFRISLNAHSVNQFDIIKNNLLRQKALELAKKLKNKTLNINKIDENLRDEVLRQLEYLNIIENSENEIKRITSKIESIHSEDPAITQFKEISQNIKIEDLNENELEILDSMISNLATVELDDLENMLDQRFGVFNKTITQQTIENLIIQLNSLPSIDIIKEIEIFRQQEVITDYSDQSLSDFAKRIISEFDITEKQSIAVTYYLFNKSRKYEFEKHNGSFKNIKKRIAQIKANRNFQEIRNKLKDKFINLAEYCNSKKENKILILFVKELFG